MTEAQYNATEFLARLNEVIAVKKLDPKAVHERTGIPYDQLGRLGTGPRGPSAAKLKQIVVGLELDANFLLDTDERYQVMNPVQRVAHMSLDRYLVIRHRAGSPVDDVDVSELRHVAYHSAVPPLWRKDWEIHHERMHVSAQGRQTPPRRESPRPRIRSRRTAM